MDMDNQARLQVLLAVLARRYDAVERLRERVYSISIGTLGVFLAAAGLLVQGEVQLNVAGKLFLAVVVVFATIAVVLYIKDLEKGFNGQYRLIVRVEEVLMLYEPGFYGSPGEGLYPQSWALAGAKGGPGRFFRRTYLLLYLGAGLLVVAIGASGLLF